MRVDIEIASVDERIGHQLDAILHHTDFQRLEAAWRGLKFLVDHTDFRKNVRIEVLDVDKETLRRDFEDAPDITQSGLFRHTYTEEYDTPGGQPIAALISDYAFDRSPQDMALLRDISKVAAAAHMPFIGAVSSEFFGKASMEEVVAIRDLRAYFERAEYLRWNSLRKTDDARYLGLTLPRFLARLPYGADTTPVRSFNYTEAVNASDHSQYLWANASFAFATNLVRSFVRNGWCIQIRGPRAGGIVEDLPTQLYALGAGNLAKIRTDALVPETREFEFAHLGLIALSHYQNHDEACFYSAHSAQRPEDFDTKEASVVVPIALERVRGTVWTGQIQDERLIEDADYYLSVQAALPAHALIEQFPRLCKAGAPDEVEQIVNSALSGIPIKPMSRLPAAIPVRIENQYFALDASHPAFKRMIDARACQFYVPASIPDVSLELYAVLPT
jgi:type VI secretion system protein ImpC